MNEIPLRVCPFFVNILSINCVTSTCYFMHGCVAGSERLYTGLWKLKSSNAALKKLKHVNAAYNQKAVAIVGTPFYVSDKVTLSASVSLYWYVSMENISETEYTQP